MNVWGLLGAVVIGSLAAVVAAAMVTFALVRVAQAIESQFTDGAAAELKKAYRALERDFSETVDALRRTENRDRMRDKRANGPLVKPPEQQSPFERLRAGRVRLGGTQ